ncbi:hypothetical protein [Brachybacterium sp. GPGPB12]|uniref:hypothetical protein n=1 Tax=Brachybacterium sp. GPGPB12 TaxID=3023517 RepID=UPI0031342620
MSTHWKLAVTADYAEADGSTIYGDIGLGALAADGIEWSLVETPIRPGALEGFDAVLAAQRHSVRGRAARGRHHAQARRPLRRRLRRRGPHRLRGARHPRHQRPHGAAGPHGAHGADLPVRPRALPCSPKDRLVREAAWDRKAEHRGPGLGSATIGMVGLGGIGQETVRQRAPSTSTSSPGTAPRAPSSAPRSGSSSSSSTR